MVFIAECDKRNVSYRWSILVADTHAVDHWLTVSDSAADQWNASTKVLIIPQDSLLPDNTYLVRVNVSLVTGAYAVVEDTLIINSPPAGGFCDVTPKTGEALLQNFTVRNAKAF